MTQNKKNAKTVEEIAQEKSFLAKNWKKLSIACGVVAILVLGFIGYKKLIAEPKAEAAAEALASSQDYIKQGQFDKALAGDGAGCIGLQAELDQYGSTKSGNLAQLYAGIAYYNQGKYAEAVTALEGYDACGEPTIDAAAEAALGNCYACVKEYDKAVKALTNAASTADNATLSPMYLIQAGELYELALNDKAKALELYQKAKDTYKNSYQVQSGEIDKYIERASVK